jgi:Zn-dependent peptidase ImmA (M78 family)
MPMNSEKLRLLLSSRVPPAALDYCIALWEQYTFTFKLRKKRITKVGDFSCRKNQVPTITVNQDSHPYLFVLTYVHEVAHLIVHRNHGWKAEAHG